VATLANAMKLVIEGCALPGRLSCDSEGRLLDNVHVGVQLRRDPAWLVPGDAPSALWELDLEVLETDDGLDFRGPAVQGRKGERFVYLSWVHVDADDGIEMFARAKLMLSRVDDDLVRCASTEGGLRALVHLSDSNGRPRCARVDPPAVLWQPL